MAEGENILIRKRIYCPECAGKGLQVPLKRYQLTDAYYLVLCTDKTNCSFHETGSGVAQVNIEDLVDCGLPEQLLEFMDVYQEDLNKIVCLGFYEYFVNNYLNAKNSIEQWQEAEQLFQHIVSYHQLETALPVCFDRGPYGFQTTKSALESSIADLSPEYKATVKDIFSKIKSYKFPEDFVNSLLNKNKKLLDK